jgi:hypothetical protein
VTPHLRELLLEWTSAPEWTPAEGCWRRREGGRWGGGGGGGEAPSCTGFLPRVLPPIMHLFDILDVNILFYKLG